MTGGHRGRGGRIGRRGAGLTRCDGIGGRSSNGLSGAVDIGTGGRIGGRLRAGLRLRTGLCLCLRARCSDCKSTGASSSSCLRTSGCLKG